MHKNTPAESVSANNQPLGLSDFAGAWQLYKHIQQKDGAVFVFEGQAEFTYADSYLHYHESGMVSAPDGRTLQAARSYKWRQLDNGHIEVLFDDNRFFHTFSLAAPVAEHLCGADHYVVDYGFSGWPEWTSTWQVTGPRKDYTMFSRFTRQ